MAMDIFNYKEIKEHCMQWDESVVQFIQLVLLILFIGYLIYGDDQ